MTVLCPCLAGMFGARLEPGKERPCCFMRKQYDAFCACFISNFHADSKSLIGLSVVQHLGNLQDLIFRHRFPL